MLATSASDLSKRIVQVRHYSLCDEDCGEGHHNPDFRTCDRCGAMIHTDVFDVVYTDGAEETVGSECMKRVMGRRWGKSHDIAVGEGVHLVHDIMALYHTGPDANWWQTAMDKGCQLERLPNNRLLLMSTDTRIAYEFRDARRVRCWTRPTNFRVKWLNTLTARAGHDIGLWELTQNGNAVFWPTWFTTSGGESNV